MDQKVFEQQVLTELQGRLPELYFELRDVDKLQSGSYRGLAVSREGSPVTALVSLAPYKARVDSGEDFRGVMDELCERADSAVRSTAAIEPVGLTDYGKVQGRLCVQLVCADNNRALLDQYPHRLIGDMAMIARIKLGERDGGEMSAAMTNSMMKGFGVNEETLFSDALSSGMYNSPATLRTVIEELGGVADMPAAPGPGAVPGFWVASNERKTNGAAVILYPGFLEEAAEKLGSDFFIIPSSVHEMLLLPDDGKVKAADLARIQHEVNESELMPEELLSRQVFYYDTAERKLELASEHEERMAEQTGWLGEALAEELPDPDELPWPDEEPPREETIRVLLVEPEQYPREVEISNDLQGLQGAVGDMIETVYPFEDEACIVCDDMGKINGLPLNRALRDDKGNVADAIAGPFLVVGLQVDGFRSLDADQMSRYEKQFHQPEMFLRMGKGIMALPIPDESIRLKEASKAETARDGGQKAAGTNRKDPADKGRNKSRRQPER